jgi:hypothetical protein
MGKVKIYFGTDGKTLRSKDILLIEKILFKIKGDDYVSFYTTLIDVTDVLPLYEERLSGEASTTYGTYYSFDHLTSLSKIIPLSSLCYKNTGNPVPNTVPGCCIVR